MKEENNFQSEALSILSSEKAEWERPTVFVTNKVAFDIRSLIEQCRRNYWGVFNTPNDEVTGRKKIWIPLTEATVEAAVKNADLDTKDINFRSKNGKAYGLVHVIRAYMKNCLDDSNFGQKLDDLIRRLAIDGTSVWKIIEKKEDGEYVADIRPVDILNFYIDPTATSIKDTGAVIERSLMLKDELRSMSGLMNVEEAKESNALSKDDSVAQGSSNTGAVKYVEVFERWGLLPEYLITGKKDDVRMIETHMIASGTDGKFVFHLLEKNTSGKRPYVEAQWKRVPGRWHGRGIAEMLIMIQSWLNSIVNIRINRAYVSQLGIFKMRRGSGIPPQMFSRLAANGILTVNNMDDIEQMAIQEASNASYNDEANAVNWARQVTSVFETLTGETLPASAAATTTAIASQAAQSTFVLLKEGIGQFLDRVISEYMLPIEIKNLSNETILRMTHDPELMRDVDSYIAQSLVYMDIESGALSPAQADFKVAQIVDKLRTMGKDRFVEILDDIDITEYDVSVEITNEKLDSGILQQRLIEALKVAPQYSEQILQQIFDLGGLHFNPGQPITTIDPNTGLPSQTPNAQMDNYTQINQEGRTLTR